LDPKNCNGVAWNNEHAMVVVKVTARPRVNFVKSPYDDDFKAAGCPPCHGGLPEDFLPRDRRSRPRRRKARRIHLHLLPISPGEKANLDERLAAERGACACRASAKVAGMGRACYHYAAEREFA